MTQYRRAKIKGGTYFFTIVTFKRQNILINANNISYLKDAFRYAKKNHPFKIDAIVVLPNHFHCIFTLPHGDNDYPKRIRLIKAHFSRNCINIQKENTISKIKKKEKAVWQRRYWEHVIRDDIDYKRHVDYIHYNPVKHGLVNAPKDWLYSSFHSYVQRGIYTQNWGSCDIVFAKGIGAE